MKEILYKDMFVGMRVKDKDGDTGTIKEIEDEHNVEVHYDNGGQAIHCTVKDCHETIELEDVSGEILIYSPLYYVDE